MISRIFFKGIVVCLAVALLDGTAAAAAARDEQPAEEEPVEKAKPVVCPNCFEVNKADARFCWNDGFALPKPREKKEIQVGKPLVADEVMMPVSLRLSDADLAWLVDRLAARLDERLGGDDYSDRVGSMTRAELTRLLRHAIERENRVPEIKTGSGFGGFLEFVGGATLVLIGIGLVASAGD
ncbi:MAG: zinc ribbon domain-containing protein [Candidatus Krumholzibacteria bacterium]